MNTRSDNKAVSKRIYYINARKLVQLEQMEIEAENEEVAVAAYLQLAHDGQVNISDPSWYALDEGDLDVEDHGEAPNDVRQSND